MALQDFYIIHNSGIPLADYSFSDKPNRCNPAFVAGGIVGIVSILKEIVREKEKITQIRYGDFNLLFQMDESNEVIFLLIVDDEPNGYVEKLKIFSQEFYVNFKQFIDKIEEYCFDCDLWQSAEDLIYKHFVAPKTIYMEVLKENDASGYD